MIKKALFSGAVIVYLAAGAQAADIVEPAAFDWTGPYLGLQAGAAFTGSNRGVDEDGYIILGERVGLDSQTDFIGGVTAGYNYQIDQFVLGAEADLSYWSYKADGRSDFIGDETKYKADADWLGTIRARLGFALDTTLIYATGGAAYADLEYSAHDGSTAVGINSIDADEKKHWGWTVGGGIEQAFSDNLSAKIEYLYAQFPGATASGTDSITGNRFDFDFDNTDVHVVRAGLNWHF